MGPRESRNAWNFASAPGYHDGRYCHTCYINMRGTDRTECEIDSLRAASESQLAELHAISDALGTNEGDSSVDHIKDLHAELAAAKAAFNSRHEEIEQARKDRDAAQADLAKAHAAHAITAMDRLELCKANERLRALCESIKANSERISRFCDDAAGRGEEMK